MAERGSQTDPRSERRWKRRLLSPQNPFRPRSVPPSPTKRLRAGAHKSSPPHKIIVIDVDEDDDSPPPTIIDVCDSTGAGNRDHQEQALHGHDDHQEYNFHGRDDHRELDIHDRAPASEGSGGKLDPEYKFFWDNVKDTTKGNLVLEIAAEDEVNPRIISYEVPAHGSPGGSVTETPNAVTEKMEEELTCSAKGKTLDADARGTCVSDAIGLARNCEMNVNVMEGGWETDAEYKFFLDNMREEDEGYVLENDVGDKTTPLVNNYEIGRESLDAVDLKNGRLDDVGDARDTCFSDGDGEMVVNVLEGSGKMDAFYKSFFEDLSENVVQVDVDDKTKHDCTEDNRVSVGGTEVNFNSDFDSVSGSDGCGEDKDNSISDCDGEANGEDCSKVGDNKYHCVSDSDDGNDHHVPDAVSDDDDDGKEHCASSGDHVESHSAFDDTKYRRVSDSDDGEDHRASDAADVKDHGDDAKEHCASDGDDAKEHSSDDDDMVDECYKVFLLCLKPDGEIVDFSTLKGKMETNINDHCYQNSDANSNKEEKSNTDKGLKTEFNSFRRDELKFREELMDVRRKPYDPNEYKQLWAEISTRKPVQQNRELRGTTKQYSGDRIGKSYLDYHPDLASIIKSVKNDKPRVLNQLRGFFFWLKNLCRRGSFVPWKDSAFLEMLPETSNPSVSKTLPEPSYREKHISSKTYCKLGIKLM